MLARHPSENTFTIFWICDKGLINWSFVFPAPRIYRNGEKHIILITLIHFHVLIIRLGRSVESKIKKLVIMLCMLSIPSLSFAENLVLLRKDKDQISYYEPDTIRRTQQLVMAWAVVKKDGKKYLEYLTEFDCKKGIYRQISFRGFDSDSKVISGDAIYREWFNVPSTTQVLGILFSKICTGN